MPNQFGRVGPAQSDIDAPFEGLFRIESERNMPLIRCKEFPSDQLTLVSIFRLQASGVRPLAGGLEVKARRPGRRRQ